jgi:hypothetical protein
MKEHEILKYIILDISDAVDNGIAVRTEGGDQPANPPEIVVSWTADRLDNYNGHTSYVGPVRDSGGNAAGRRFHTYFLMDLDVMVRHEDELERDKLLHEIHEALVPYEYDPSAFNDDTAEWSCGVASPRNNSFVEPDWYEMGIPVSFVYLKEIEQTDSGALPGVIQSIDIYVNDRDYVVEEGTGETIGPDATRYYRTLTVNGDLTIEGTVYTQSYSVGINGSLTVNGDLIEVDEPYSEITETQQETKI